MLLLAQHLWVFRLRASEAGFPAPGRLRARGTSYAKEHFERVVANPLPLQNERKNMLLLLSPFLASGIWIGGGSVGLILVIVVVVLLLRG